MGCINCGKPLDDKNAVFCDECYKKAVASKTTGYDVTDTQHAEYSHRRHSKHTKPKKIKRNVIIAVVAVLIAIIAVALIWFFSVMGKIKRDDLSSDLGIKNSSELPFNEDVKNIALYGLDSRSNNSTGRSDAIVVLSIDRINKEIKMTSIARDTYISFESGKKDKITHAWAYGKADLAVKTLNRNFSLDVTDYVSMNFFQFAEIIDYIGGVTIDVDLDELRVMNDNYIRELNRIGIPCSFVKAPGVQLLTGGQALAYTRNRYTGSDLERGNRQREVLQAMFNKVKKMNKLKLPKLVELVCGNCTTSLKNSEMLSIGLWAVASKPSIRSMGLPTNACNPHGQTIKGTSYMVYDLDIATDVLHKFIYTGADETSSALYSNSSAQGGSSSKLSVSSEK